MKYLLYLAFKDNLRSSLLGEPNFLGVVYEIEGDQIPKNYFKNNLKTTKTGCIIGHSGTDNFALFLCMDLVRSRKIIKQKEVKVELDKSNKLKPVFGLSGSKAKPTINARFVESRQYSEIYGHCIICETGVSKKYQQKNENKNFVAQNLVFEDTQDLFLGFFDC